LEAIVDATTTSRIEEPFASRVPEEKARVISHGAALRLSDLRKRLHRARSRARHFEEPHHTHLETFLHHKRVDCRDNLLPSRETCLEEVMALILSDEPG
jgi:hypothetical protein